MSLSLHYQMLPMFGTVQAPKTVLMCGRQLGKSYTLCSSMALRSMLIPNYHTVIIQPRADQIQRLMNTVYKPLMNSCPIRDEFITSTELGKLGLRQFNNGSLCYAEFMFNSADRIRGISGAATVALDEAQDIEYSYIDIAAEVTSASLFWGFMQYSGTPKTTDTTLALLWDSSSQAEWVIKCMHCGHFNVPNPDHDLMRMIGKHGPICAKCGKPVYPKDGGYVHAFPDRSMSFPGYHISQTIHPLHMINDMKWGRLLDKVDHYTELTLYNEVFGWPYDAATSPLALSDIKRAVHNIPKVERPSDLQGVLDNYRYVTVGVDWGGGGAFSDSYTAYAVLGLRKDDDVIDVLYGKRIPHNVTPSDEADEILSWINGVGADAFAYDNGGAGFARLEIMKHRGLNATNDLVVVPINYTGPSAGDVMRPKVNQRESDMYYYTLDKSRSLAICIMSIKSMRIQFPSWINLDDTDAYPRDFLALREDPRKTVANDTVIVIIKRPGVPDDFAHAVNFGCSQIWDHFGAYPRIGTKYDTSLLVGDADVSDMGPRGDFERFRDAVDQRSVVMDTFADDFEIDF